MKVAVITPYYRERIEVLRQCHESVAAQRHPCTHFMVADGHPRDEVASWAVQHIVLPTSHGDNGNTPRAVGSLSAANEGFDAIAYLDADNWYAPEHLETMVRLQAETGAAVCTAARSMHRLDGSLLYVDTVECDGDTFADTSCLFLTRAAFRITALWAFIPKPLAPVCDKVFWQALRGLDLTRAHSDVPTVAFRTQYDAHYRHVGEAPPAGAKSSKDVHEAADRWWFGLSDGERERWGAYFRTGRW